MSSEKTSNEKQISIFKALCDSNNIDRMLLITMPFVIGLLVMFIDNDVYPETSCVLLYSIFMFLFIRYCSFFIGLFVFPFIPLYLIASYTPLFYLFLISYSCFFVYINRIKFKYKWSEIIVFTLFFIFCTTMMKSLIDYNIVDEKEIVKGAVVYGSLN